MNSENRREVATRKVAVFQKLSQRLVLLKLTPNQISLASSVFAIVAGVSIAMTFKCENKIPLLVVGILGIQLRLICNLIDGLMAVEGGLKTASGELYNDIPDRVSDVAIIMGASWAAQACCPEIVHVGWLASIFAVLTAYIRTLGASMTGRHDFSGPMAKQHRMFLITLGCAGTIVETFGVWPMGYALSFVICIILLGSILTCVNRIYRIYAQLENK